MKRALAVFVILIGAFCAVPARAIGAQQRGVVNVTVRGDKEELLGDVRVHITAQNVDTTVRTGVKGSFTLILPEGRVHFSLARIGYAPTEVDVMLVNMTVIKMQMRALPQQLSAVNVREDWIGIRGVVGDDSTMEVLKGVTIKSMKRTIELVTDSQGRFEFSLPKRERTSLTLSRDGYLSKPFVVPMDSTNSADVIVLMKRGADPIFMKYAMIDFEHRMGWGGIGMFVMDHDKLSATGELYLDNAIARSGMLIRKGISGTPRVFLNGQPSNASVLHHIRAADVELVEWWGQGSEATCTFAARWPGGVCGKSGGGPWVSIWLRR